MNSNRFDSWTRHRATAQNRRTLLGLSAAAGLTAVLSRVLPAAGAFANGASCTYDVKITSSLTSGQSISGTLVIDVGTGGTIDTGSLTLPGQQAASVVGQVSGFEISVLASLGDGSLLSLTGVAAPSSGACAPFVSGSFSNADSGQIGTWQAQPGESASVPTATPTPITTGNTNAAPTPTPTPAQPTGTCESPKMVCGQNCCPAGADCLDNRSCQCPTGTEECGIACFPSCPDGVTPLEPVNCLCPNA